MSSKEREGSAASTLARLARSLAISNDPAFISNNVTFTSAAAPAPAPSPLPVLAPSPAKIAANGSAT